VASLAVLIRLRADLIRASVALSDNCCYANAWGFYTEPMFVQAILGLLKMLIVVDSCWIYLEGLGRIVGALKPLELAPQGLLDTLKP